MSWGGYSSAGTGGGYSAPPAGGGISYPMPGAYQSSGATSGYGSAPPLPTTPYGGGASAGYGGGAAAGYGGAAAGGYGGAAAAGYGGGASAGYGGGARAGYGGGAAAQGYGSGGASAGGGRNIGSSLMALSQQGGDGGGFKSSRGGGLGSGSTMGGGGGGGRSGGLNMSKFAAYQTNNKRKYEDRGGGGSRGGRGGGGGRGGFDKRPRYEVEERKPREGREPMLDLYIDQKFNFWNLPVKARVLLISNVPQAICQPDLLYNLFSFYGDVERIKILRRKTTCALVEFATASFAAIARDHLDGILVKGDKLVVTFSRFDRVKMPEEAGLPPDDMTKDFSGTEYQRVKRYWNEDLKKQNMKKLMKPSKTIHISGIQAGTSPNDVKRAFEGSGLDVDGVLGVAVRAKSKKAETLPAVVAKPRMFCYLEFTSPDDGVLGLAQYGNSAGMRISFATDDITALRQQCLNKGMELIEGDNKA